MLTYGRRRACVIHSTVGFADRLMGNTIAVENLMMIFFSLLIAQHSSPLLDFSLFCLLNIEIIFFKQEDYYANKCEVKMSIIIHAVHKVSGRLMQAKLNWI